MLKKVLIILYICIIGAIIYFAVDFFAIRKDADLNDSTDRAKERTEKISEQDNEKERSEKNNESKEENKINDSDDSENNNPSITQENAAYDITQADCKNDCKDYDNDEKDYCRNICGLTGSITEEKSCDGLSGLQKDYCIKDNAIQNKDLDMCKEIADGGLYDQCINRLTEEFIDQIM